MKNLQSLKTVKLYSLRHSDHNAKKRICLHGLVQNSFIGAPFTIIRWPESEDTAISLPWHAPWKHQKSDINDQLTTFVIWEAETAVAIRCHRFQNRFSNLCSHVSLLRMMNYDFEPYSSGRELSYDIPLSLVRLLFVYPPS